MVDNAGFANKKQAISGHLYKKFIADRRCHNSSFLTPHSTNAAFFIKNVGLSIILDTIIKKFDRRKPFEGTHRTVVCST